MSYYQQGRGELLADHTEGCRVQKADIIMLNATYSYKPMHTSICTQTLCMYNGIWSVPTQESVAI